MQSGGKCLMERENSQSFPRRAHPPNLDPFKLSQEHGITPRGPQLHHSEKSPKMETRFNTHHCSISTKPRTN